ncbi:unnamed protein product, partial [Heterotrigona itama]
MRNNVHRDHDLASAFVSRVICNDCDKITTEVNHSRKQTRHDGKFHLLPTGELLVHSLEFSDQIHGYRCRTMHRLTRQVVVSSVANVRIAGNHRGVMPPVILENSGVVHVAQDESTSLVCVAQACPTPEYR